MLRPRRMPVDEPDAPFWTAQQSTTSRGPHVQLPTDGRAAPRSRRRRTDVRQRLTSLPGGNPSPNQVFGRLASRTGRDGRQGIWWYQLDTLGEDSSPTRRCPTRWARRFLPNATDGTTTTRGGHDSMCARTSASES